MYKVVWVARFRDGMARDEARRHWAETHGPLGAHVAQIERYVQNHVVSAVGATGETDAIATEYDGFSECWFDDEAAFEHAMASPEWLRMNEDAEGLFDIEYSVPSMSAVLDEHVIVAGAEELAHAEPVNLVERGVVCTR